MLSPIPRRSGWAYSCSLTQPYQPSPKWQSGRPAHCPFRGLLGVHSRYGLHTRAVTVYRDTLSEGFSHFVTSMTAPVASGWSGCRVGLAPTGKRRLVTAHARSRHVQGSKRGCCFRCSRFGKPVIEPRKPATDWKSAAVRRLVARWQADAETTLLELLPHVLEALILRERERA